jgi:hypothetical protein
LTPFLSVAHNHAHGHPDKKGVKEEVAICGWRMIKYIIEENRNSSQFNKDEKISLQSIVAKKRIGTRSALAEWPRFLQLVGKRATFSDDLVQCAFSLVLSLGMQRKNRILRLRKK